MKPLLRQYLFRQTGQWRAGLSQGFSVTDTGLKSMAGVQSKILYTLDEAGWLVCPDSGQTVYAFNPQDSAVYRIDESGQHPLGCLHDANPEQASFRQLWVQGEWLWLRLEHTLASGECRGSVVLYHLDSLERLGEQHFPGTLLDMCSGQVDCIWLLTGNQGQKAEIIQLRLEDSGFQQTTYLLPEAITQGQILCVDSRLFILSAGEVWKLWRVSCGSLNPAQKPEIQLIAESRNKPCLPAICLGSAQNDVPYSGYFQVDGLGGVAVRNCWPDALCLLDSKQGCVRVLSPEGEWLTEIKDLVPDAALENDPVSANKSLTIVNGCCNSLLQTGQHLLNFVRSDQLHDNPGLYLSPVLRSPPGVNSGWARLELTVDLPDKADLLVEVFAYDDVNQARNFQSLMADTTPVAGRLEQVQGLLSRPAMLTRQFTRRDITQAGLLHLPLHRIDREYICLRLQYSSELAEDTIQLQQMRVLYPEDSYIRHLPAIYRQDKSSTALLRDVLAVFESVFTAQDEELDGLPDTINPDTAPAGRLPELMQWLGLPAAPELNETLQRQLLQQAADLLDRRGTHSALKKLLQLLLVDSGWASGFILEDTGSRAPVWLLPQADGLYQSRLGQDTPLTQATLQGGQLNAQARLGEWATGVMGSDAASLFRQYNGKVVLKVALRNADQRDVCLRLLQRFLPYFIPAHCRYELELFDPGALSTVPDLAPGDEAMVLEVSPETRLGQTGRLGEMVLPESRTANRLQQFGNPLQQTGLPLGGAGDDEEEEI